jgi:hypothetical protein
MESSWHYIHYTGHGCSKNEGSALAIDFCMDIILSLCVWSVAKGIYPSSIRKRQRIALGGWILSGGLFCWLYFFIAPTIQPAISPTAVFIDCVWDSVPMRIPASSTVHVLRLHPKLGLDWGLSEEGNLGNKEKLWPTGAEAIFKNKGSSDFTYKCSVSNDGPTLLMDVAIRFSISFTNAGTPPPKLYDINHTVILNPLNPGKPFVFYVINYCELFAHAIIPDTATVQVMGETNRREGAFK